MTAPGPLESGIRDLVLRLVREDDELRREIAELAPAPPPSPPPGDTMSSDEAAAYLKVSRATLEQNRCHGKGPPYERAGRRIVYRRSVVDEWLKRGGR